MTPNRKRSAMSDELCRTCGYMRDEQTTCRCGLLKAESSFAAPTGLEAGLCECAHWARSINPKYLTNHHENCQHYNDSLMVVWKVSDGSSSFYVENEQDAREMAGCEDLTISQVKIHREVFEHLPEFEGF